MFHVSSSALSSSSVAGVVLERVGSCRNMHWCIQVTRQQLRSNYNWQQQSAVIQLSEFNREQNTTRRRNQGLETHEQQTVDILTDGSTAVILLLAVGHLYHSLWILQSLIVIGASGDDNELFPYQCLNGQTQSNAMLR